MGSPCLVRDDDDIWYEAKIRKILDDAQFRIKFKANNVFKTVGVKDLFPLSKSLILLCLFSGSSICLKRPTIVSVYPCDCDTELALLFSFSGLINQDDRPHYT